MSSMLAMIRKGKFDCAAAEFTLQLMPKLKSSNLIPARIDCSLLSLDRQKGEPIQEFMKLPRPVLPYGLMWLESKVKDLEINALAIRRDSGQLIETCAIFWMSGIGGPLPVAIGSWACDLSGEPIADTFGTNLFLKNTGADKAFIDCSDAMLFVIAHWCARAQCENARMVVRKECKYVPRGRHLPTPMSSWRELEFREIPKSQSTGRSVFVEPREIRCSWVRGHFADYRFGPGHFGRADCKYVLWIPEHKRGDEKLGTIKPGYIVN